MEEQRQFPKELLDKLRDFVLTFINDKFIDGVTYGLFFDKESEITAKCDEIYLDTTDYFGENGVMRRVKTCNGFIYDIDMSVVGYILKDWLDNPAGSKSVDVSDYDKLIGNLPEIRREEDIKKFGKLCYDTYKQGKRKLEVALYSLSPIPSVIITGRDKDNNLVSLYYPTFAIRQWDIDKVNKQYLVPNHIRVSKLEVCDILPSREGVRYIAHLADVMQ